jgi:hypothetical protein
VVDFKYLLGVTDRFVVGFGYEETSYHPFSDALSLSGCRAKRVNTKK